MNRIITILVTIFILLLLYIWISHVWGSDNPRHPRQIVDAQENQMTDDPMADEDTTTYQAPAGDGVAEQPATTEEDEYATERKVDESVETKTEPVKTEPVKSEPVVEKKVQEPKKAEPKPEPKKTTPPPTPVSKPAAAPAKPVLKPAAATSTGSEMHLVIAGNFTQKVNADQRVAELKKAGFPNAEVINFDLSEYYTVCVARFSDVNEARKLVKKLKDYHKIDAYVRIGG